MNRQLTVPPHRRVAVNVETRSTELSHITEWAKPNNLKLNLAKTHEIIFVDRKRKQKYLNQLKFLNFTELGL